MCRPFAFQGHRAMRVRIGVVNAAERTWVKRAIDVRVRELLADAGCDRHATVEPACVGCRRRRRKLAAEAANASPSAQA